MAVSRLAALCAIALASTGGIASGTTVSIPLPGLLSYTQGNKTVNFDAGVQFQSISQVRIHLAGTVTPGVWNYTNPATGESGQMAVPTYLGPGLGSGFILQAIAQVPNPVNGTFPFEFWSPGGDYGFLLDGKDKITMTLMYAFSGNLVWGEGVSSGSATISAATLLIDGVVVPEPMSLSLLAVAGLFASRRRRG